ncbi:PTS mannitol transporter subunit IICBA [Pectobacterium parmentieri]|uniref:PTS mannitol transporter subunit IICBA n=1 Tax=Pectobacterium parmentieri TaxID=1905730 RepID=UPI000EB42985|nr:PTS mannitol transporter subunit IICBA [Pectobacterium parmentieri]AYH03520.1 PTS mannitol transporter subunit IICBA [Pectobacterium parmentieri]AYH29777.1 PTS mannitol transporter subunit IICBA [Pectobacterium parmentieri]AYH34195.1 PTS mannitol transporter subunit IICBA [Pectobacterium parmentieri]MBI0519193.1 PTS mannitol transporter subunit IICBA [Pectobacterium parmentieri]
MLSPDIKIKVQNFGRFLSNMVMPNIGAFIAWGIITALFIPTGWIPNDTLAKLVGPMITYLLPLLIGYTGGRLVFGERGGVVGAITTMGVIVGTDIPMFLGAMIVGPLGGWTIKRFDRMVDGKIKSGFEMLVNNFSAGIIGMLLAILSFLAIGPLVEVFSQVLASGVNLMVQNNLLPFTSIFVEPAKILFLNNAINHGIFSPLGIQQATETGKSIFFLIEANPGPGMGVLMAYMFFGRGNAKESAPGAAIIHFLGGIHEIYFPYVLMNPRLIIAVILGGMTGVFTLSVLGGGLVSPASPGSILAVLAMTPKGAYFANLAAIAAAFAVSFIVSAILLKSTKQKEEDLSDATRRVQEMKASSKGAATNTGVSGDMSTVRKIIVACDAGMGSSAMGAGVLRKKVQDAGLTNISVTNSAINSLPDDVDLVITHRDLTERAMRHAPQAQHISLTNFLDSGLYSDLAARLVAAQGAAQPETVATPAPVVADTQTNLFQLGAGNVFLNQHATHKEQAIRFAGERLVKGGYVEPEYVEAMLEREKLTSTYLGESIAVPHGTIEAKDRVLKTGVVFCQYPEGVRFGDEEDEVARLVIGIAARNNEHIQVITSLTNALDDDAVIERLAHTQDVQEVLDLLSGKKSA